MTMIDLSQYPVIDNHCHPFLPEKEKEEFDQLRNLSTLSIPKLHSENTILYRKVMAELSRVMGCSLEFHEILRKRKEEYYSNPSKYVAKLFKDANIDTLIIDTGYPSEEYTEYSVPFEDFQKIVNCKLKCIYRLEPLLFRLFQVSPPFDEMVEKYLEALESAVKIDGFIGFKSVIAYVFGLEVHKEDEHAARDAYERLKREKLLTVPLIKKDLKTISDEKILRDYLIWLGIKKSIELDVPFQIHTGMGDSPYIDVRDANPLHLFEVMTDEELKEAKLVLLHGGYPYVEEAGFLVNSYPNVYVDLSEMMPFVGPGMKEKVLQLLQMCPTTKILYGSDGYNIPELFWISAIWGKQAISEALQELVRSKAINEDYAYKVGSLILSENAIRLYKL